MPDNPPEHYDILADAIGRLEENTPQTRREVYDRARKWLMDAAHTADPPWPLLDLVREQRALEEAIEELESRYAEIEIVQPREAPSPEVPAHRPPERWRQKPRAGRDRWWIWIGIAALLLAGLIGIALFAYGRIGLPSGAPPAAEQPRAPAADTAPADSATRVQRAREALDRGEQRVRVNDFGGAIGEYSEAIRLDPENAAGYNNRAFAFWSIGETDRAIGDYSEAIRLDPANVVALGNRAVAYNFKGEYDRAIRDLDEAIRLRPNDPHVRNGRCWGRALAGRLQEALEDCNEALRLAPGDANVFDSRGLVYLKLGQWDRAIADYSAALQIDAKLAGSLYGRGFAKLKKGDKKGGEADIAAARALRADIAALFQRYGVR